MRYPAGCRILNRGKVLKMENIVNVIAALSNESVVVALIMVIFFVVTILVYARQWDKVLATFDKMLEKNEENQPIRATLEKATQRWTPERRKVATQILDVLDPLTSFTPTNLDNDVVAWMKDVVNGLEGNEQELSYDKLPQIIEALLNNSDESTNVPVKEKEAVG